MSGPRLRPVRGPAVLAAAGCAAFAFNADPAAAQEAAAPMPAVALDAIIVTGTHAKDRTELSSSAPVDIISAEDLRAAAGPEANLGDALQALLPSVNYLDQSNSGSADHVRALQLRGLNPDQVLVLINGKRVHTTSIVNVESTVGLGSVAVDFASIPVNAVKRIEVLRDGAGAQYGSDAVAGVINIILDDARGGGELSVDAGLYHTHFAPTERTINDGQTQNVQGKYGVPLGDDGFLRFGVDATHHDPTNRAGYDQFSPAYPGENLITFRVGDAGIRNLNLWENMSLPLANGSSGYSTILFNRRTSSGDAFFREPNDPVNNLPGVYPNGFLPQSSGINQDWHVGGGMRGALTDVFRYDASLTYGLNTFTYGLRDSLNASLGPSSPTNFDLGGFRFGQTTLNYDVSGDVGWFGLPSPLTLALGGELRRETYSTTPGDPASYEAGSYPSAANPDAPGSQGDGGLPPGDVADLSRTVGGLYADLSGKLTPTVFADAALRFDHYTDAGSATTGKLSARWEFIPGWGLRGSLSNNFRAPALAQIGGAYSPTTYVSSSPGGGLALGGLQIVPVSNPAAVALGAQPLKPERSTNASVGLTAQPVQALQLSLDLFRIDIRDRIALSQQISPTAGPYAGNNYEFFTNAVDTRTQGADLVGSWTGRLSGGSLVLSDASTWVDTGIRDIHATPAQLAGVPNGTDGGLLFGLQAQNALTTAVPRHRDVVTVNWSGEGKANSWNLLARTIYSGQVTRVFDFGGGDVISQTYNATVQLNLEAEYRATRDLALALGADNVTDRYPTLSSGGGNGINYGGNLPYDFLSPIGFNGRYYYLRLRYELH
jgi:iron complex outermembrane receptor protein